ncbi:MAG TPA: hypothetical protein VIM60_02620 [Edaphobacter sp.]
MILLKCNGKENTGSLSARLMLLVHDRRGSFTTAWWEAVLKA